MKKYLIFFLIVISMLSLSGCKKSNFGVSSDEKRAEIIAENASKDMFGASSGFEVAEGEKVYIEAALKKGEISVKLKAFDLGKDASVEELTGAVNGENPDIEIKLSGSDSLEYELEPGSYSVYASVLDKADGTIVITVR